jgi:hypothetical protein
MRRKGNQRDAKRARDLFPAGASVSCKQGRKKLSRLVLKLRKRDEPPLLTFIYASYCWRVL